jgi:hypothetical protein
VRRAKSQRDAPSTPNLEAVSARLYHPRANLFCVLILIAITLGVYAPALFGGRVLLPADIVPLMRPWAVTARERFPDYRFAQNQMHGPIFEYYSWRHYARERVLAGEVPLWNPYELGGNVLLANSQSAVLYPPNVLLYVFPLWVGINLVTALHTFLTGCFTLFLLRRYRLGPPAALTGALVWMFCGLQVVWTEFQTPTAVLCWLPAALLAWESAAQKRDWVRCTLISGLVVALTLLAGHLHFAFYVIVAFVLYALWRSCVMGDWRKSARPLMALAGAVVFGVALSSATMLPVFEMGRMNFRGAQDSYAASIGLRLPPKNLLTLVMPNLYGNPRDYVGFDASGQPTGGNPYFGAFDFIEYTAYLGIPALLLAAVGAGSAFRRRDRVALPARYFALVALVGLLLALGTPLCALFFYGVPGYRQFNATARALCLFSFGAAMLAAFGVEVISEAVRSGERRVVGIAGWAAGALAVLGLIAFPGMALVEKVDNGAGREVARLFTDQWFGYELANLGHFALFLASGTAVILVGTTSSRKWAVWALPAIAAADLLVWGRGFNPVTNPAMLGYPTATTGFLGDKSPDRVVSLEAPGKGIKSFIVPNYNAVVHLREVQGADSLHTRRYHRLLEEVVKATEPGRAFAFADPNTLHVPNVNHPFFDLMNVRWVTTDPDVQLPPPFRKAADAELTIWENPRALGPAWIVGEDVIGVDGPGMAASMMVEHAAELRSGYALVDRPPRYPFAASKGTATLTSFAPHRVSYDVNQSGNGLLATSEIYFPGWRPRVDGRDSPLVNLNWVQRATPVPPGRHSVVFTYEPDSYRVGLFFTCASAAILACFLTSRFGLRKPT